MTDSLKSKKNISLRSKIALGFIGSTSLFWAFPNPFFQFPLFVLVYPSVLFIFALKAESKRQAFNNGFFTGLAGYASCLYWIAVPPHDFGHFPWIGALPFPFLLASYIALYSGLFTLLCNEAKQIFLPNWPSINRKDCFLPLLQINIFCILIWSLLEYLRGWLLTGFPWLSLASAFVPWPLAIQPVSAIGTYALSGIYVGIASCLTSIIFFSYRQSQFRRIDTIAFHLFFVSLLLMGIFLWTKHAMSPQNHSNTAIGVLLVQGNINQDQKWDPDYQQETFKQYAELTSMALENLRKQPRGFNITAPLDSPSYTPDLQLAIWPETSMPFFYQEDKLITEQLQDLAKWQNINILFGAPGYEQIPGRSFKDSPLFNRAYLINSDGEDIGYYEKEHLVPFGEYAPPFLRLPILEFLLAEVGDFEPGHKISPLSINGISLGILICYETIFPELAQKRVAEGANIFINISNDAWFGKTSAPEQHLQLSTLRAVEQGRWLVRSTNTGISAVITPRGKRITQGRLFTPEIITCLAYACSQTTLFYKLEPFIPYAMLLLTALLLLPHTLFKGKQNNKKSKEKI